MNCFLKKCYLGLNQMQIQQLIKISGNQICPPASLVSGKGKGGINFLTKDEVSRIDLVKNAFIMALVSHINDDTWK